MFINRCSFVRKSGIFFHLESGDLVVYHNCSDVVFAVFA